MATYTAKWTAEYQHAMEILSQPLSENRKVMVLFKYDPFKAEWTQVAYDVADLDGDFTTNNVEKYMYFKN